MKTGIKVLVVFLGLSVSALIIFLAAASGILLQRRAGLGSGRIAVVNIRNGVYDSRNVIDLLHRYDKNPRVKGIVVRIDSPGGGVAAVQEIYLELDKIRMLGEKPVVASLGSVAASGGYLIACAADRIIANPGTVTGSIGVLISTLSMEELLGKIGIDFKTIKSGEYKDTGASVRKITSDEEVCLQTLVDDMHRQFVEVVKTRRGMDDEQVTAVSDGRIFSGEQALELNLVDELGTFYDAVETAAELAGIERWEIIEEKRRRNLWQVIFGAVSRGHGRIIAPLYLFDGAG